MKQNETISCNSNTIYFLCEKCKYSTCKKSSFNKHLLTTKHLNEMNEPAKETQVLKCMCACGDQFNSRTTLWRHKKLCKLSVENNNNYHTNYTNNNYTNGSNSNNTNTNINKNEENAPSSNIIVELVKQNQEFKQLIIEQNQKIMELTNKPTTINNIGSNNKTKFNLNFFLNEQCKDALNITDFINSLQLQFDDLENTGKLGFVEGISQIFIKNLKKLDIYKRPIHCSDIKREIMYVKEENKWEKEKEEHENLTKAIKTIACKNIKQIPTWIDEHPNCSDYYSNENDKYLKIINESMGGDTEEQQKDYYEKIVKNVSKEVLIENELTILQNTIH